MHGPIAWFARNHVASNLLMALLLAAGAYFAINRIPLEYFPESEPDVVNVSMSYRGATPSEVEEGVITRIEQAISGLAGVREMRSTASEGNGNVSVVIEKGYKARELLDDIKNRVDSINTFPQETERPIVSMDRRINRVITVVISADMQLRELRKLGEQVRDELSTIPGVTLANLRGVRPYEVSIEVSEKDLQRYAVTMTDVASAIRRSSVDLPAGGLKTTSGEILLRTKGQAYNKQDFEKIVLRAEKSGARVLVKDVAQVRDDFHEDPLYSTFNGKPCVFVQVDKSGEQNLLELADKVKQYVKDAKRHMPHGVALSVWRDQARPVHDRLSYLLENGINGAILVFLALALFLRLSLAFWVCTGIPIAFAGGLIVMHFCGVTINMFSLFGFIVVLGIVVDDAIVVGESVFTRWNDTPDNTAAAVLGTKDVSTPVTFGVMTTIVAFLPLLAMSGWRGSIFQQIPAVVIPVLLASLLETKFILPAHLATIRRQPSADTQTNFFLRGQQRLADWLEATLARRLYQRALESVLRHRYVALAGFASIFVILLGVILGGHMHWVFWPRFYTDTVSAQLEMPLGTPASTTEAHLKVMAAAAEKLKFKFRDEASGKSVVRNVLVVMGSFGSRGTPSNSGASHIAEVTLELPPYEERTIESSVITAAWRELIGEIPGAKELRFRDSYGGDDDPIDMQIAGQDFPEMLAVSDQLQEKLRTYVGVFDIRDNFEYGKQEIQIIRIKPEAEARGLTREIVARQLRQAFYGDEAQRIQRGRDDVRIMVRYPQTERISLDNLEKMKLRTPDGAEVPFASAVEAIFGRSPTSIKRLDRQRTIDVLADVDKEKMDLEGVKAELAKVMLDLKREHPTMHFRFQGEAREQSESLDQILLGSLFVLFALYALMAIPFRSYWLPFIVLAVIPFGLIGAVLGHMIKGISLSIFSVLGMLTLAGVIVNESLVLIDYINKKRDEGMEPGEAARRAGVARFRAVLLTNLTTFIGFVPLIFESGTKESFLSQMSVSLAFGVMFSFFVTLFLVPINYLVLADVRNFIQRHTTSRSRRWLGPLAGAAAAAAGGLWLTGSGLLGKNAALQELMAQANLACAFALVAIGGLSLWLILLFASSGDLCWRSAGSESEKPRTGEAT